jgi:DNA-binding transcriptional ArsR family regulator
VVGGSQSVSPKVGTVSDTERSLRTLAHPVRRRILVLLWDSEKASSEVAEGCGITKPAASQHLKALLHADLVTVRMRGTRRLYRARLDELAELREVLENFWGPLGALGGGVVPPGADGVADDGP